MSSIILSLLSAFLGGVIAIGGQCFIKYLEEIKLKKNKFNEIISNSTKLKIQLFFYFNNYAYYEQNTEYQYNQYNLEVNSIYKNKYLEEHYKSNQEMIEIQKTIINIISDFIGNATQFLILTNNKVSFKNEFDKINKIEFGFGKDYSAEIHLVSDDQVGEDIIELTKKYRNFITPFSEIISKMELLIEK